MSFGKYPGGLFPHVLSFFVGFRPTVWMDSFPGLWFFEVGESGGGLQFLFVCLILYESLWIVITWATSPNAIRIDSR